MARRNDVIRNAAPRPIALVVSIGGDGPATVREALTMAGFAARSTAPAHRGWEATDPADVVVLDGENVDVAETLVAATESGRLDPGIPVLVSAPAPIPTERQLEWLRAGAWEVVATPADSEALSLFLTNLVRGRPTRRAADPAADAPPPPQKDPYAWRPLVRVTDESLSLARRHNRPVVCLAFVPVWRDPNSASAPMLLATRLARTLLDRVRGADLVGVSDHGGVLIILPDTDTVGAAIIQNRLLATLRDEIRAWGMVTGIGAGLVELEPDDSAAGFLLRAVGQAA